MNWEKKKVFITGAGGFIGSHLAEGLVERGASVKAFVRYNSRRDTGCLKVLPPKIQRQIEIIFGDLRNPDDARRNLKQSNIIFHLGALIAIPYSYVNPREVVETNVLGTLNILSACLGEDVERIIHTSTSEVYGTAEYVPIDEKHPLKGQSPYSASKVGADKIAESFFCSYQLPVVIVRPFNTYGPRQSARAIIPTLITQALTKDKISVGSLHPRRDFTYVSDIVSGFIKVAEGKNALGTVVNLGSNTEISIGDLAKEIFELLGKTSVKMIQAPERIRPTQSEVERLWADNSKAKTCFGWFPTISLKEGLSRTIAWVQEHPDFYTEEESYVI